MGALFGEYIGQVMIDRRDPLLVVYNDHTRAYKCKPSGLDIYCLERVQSDSK